MPILLLALRIAFPDLFAGLSEEEKLCAKRHEAGFLCKGEHREATFLPWRDTPPGEYLDLSRG